jgi:hypothetical protein
MTPLQKPKSPIENVESGEDSDNAPDDGPGVRVAHKRREIQQCANQRADPSGEFDTPQEG